MHIEPRNGASIDRVYIHTNEGPETQNGAANLAAYLKTIDGGYHAIVDSESLQRPAQDDQIVWGAGGDNTHSLHVCLIGRANQTPAQWADPYSTATIERAAQQVAGWCHAYNIPAVHVTGQPGKAPTDRGIAEHADNHSSLSEGHSDPGPFFPLAAFVARVNELLYALSHAGVQAIIDWGKRMTVSPLHAGDSSHDVTTLKHLLHAIGEGLEPPNELPFYGDDLVVVIHRFKIKHVRGNKDGRVWGGPASKALIKLLFA